MRSKLLAAMSAAGGVMTRTQILRVVPKHVLERATQSAVVVRIHPEVYALGTRFAEPDVLDRAAIARFPTGALSHPTALRIWRLPHIALTAERRHVTIAPERFVRSTSALFVHRRQTFAAGPPLTVTRNGLEVVRIEQAIIESWPFLTPATRRAPAIAAVSQRLTTPERLIEVLFAQPWTTGVVGLYGLFRLLEDGCRSELGRWGHQRVFNDPSLPEAHLQYAVTVGGLTYYLDRAYVAIKVGVELDGAAWHGSRQQRERDVRRDAALAAAGWVIVRFTHARLTSNPRACRDELAAIVAARRQQLRAG
jgi:very-short-patch-repair endonuclease